MSSTHRWQRIAIPLVIYIATNALVGRVAEVVPDLPFAWKAVLVFAIGKVVGDGLYSLLQGIPILDYMEDRLLVLLGYLFLGLLAAGVYAVTEAWGYHTQPSLAILVAVIYLLDMSSGSAD